MTSFSICCSISAIVPILLLFGVYWSGLAVMPKMKKPVAAPEPLAMKRPMGLKAPPAKRPAAAVALLRPARATIDVPDKKLGAVSRKSKGLCANSVADDICKRLLAQLHPQFREQLKTNLVSLGPVHMGSACTGTNAGSIGAAHVIEAVGIGELVEDFICEKVYLELKL
jgi:hypothetical protein